MAKITTFTKVQATENLLDNTQVSTITTAAAVTFTPAQLLGNLVLRDPNGLARADVLPTAASLYAALENPVKIAGLTFRFTIRNTADAAETITLTANTGATISGTATIAQSNSKEFMIVFTSPTAYVAYSLGTVVH
jgi:hypothetical protein